MVSNLLDCTGIGNGDVCLHERLPGDSVEISAGSRPIKDTFLFFGVEEPKSESVLVLDFFAEEGVNGDV